MPELGTDLRRAMQQIRPPVYSIVDVARRRNRRRRNQRIGSALLALTIAAAAVGLVVRAFSAYRERPAGRAISPRSVERLDLRWHASVDAGISFPAVADGVVSVGAFPLGKGSSELLVYPEDCAQRSGQCRPLWRTEIPSLFAGSAVANGMVYATTGQQGQPAKLWAFRATCRTDGGRCGPLWTANLGLGGAHVPVVADGLVYAGTWVGVEAFPAECRTDGGACTPLWRAETVLPTWVLTADDGMVYAGAAREGKYGVRAAEKGAVYAFPAKCTTPCEPIWSEDSLGGISDLFVDDGRVFVGTTAGPLSGRPGLYAFSADCIAGGGQCRPLWTADTACCTVGTAGDGMVFVLDMGKAVYGFRADCRVDGGSCEPTWTASVSPMSGAGEPVFRGGVVFVAGGLGQETVWAFPAQCRDPCRPVWSGRVGGSVLGVAASQTSLVTTGDAGLVVFSPDTRPKRRAPPDTPAALYVAIFVLVGLAALIRARHKGRGLR